MNPHGILLVMPIIVPFLLQVTRGWPSLVDIIEDVPWITVFVIGVLLPSELGIWRILVS